MNYSFHWRPVWRAMPDLLVAAQLTLEITVFSMIIGTLLGLLLALGRQTRQPLVYSPCVAWVEVARNTPALFQVYMAYFGLGAFGLHLSSYMAVLGAIAFNNAGYLAETFRGGLNSINRTQYSAARSLGMRPWQAYVYVVLPQVFRMVYYPWTNQLMWALLNTSLGMLVGLQELSGATAFAQSLSFRSFEFFSAAAVLYYIIAKIVMGLSRLVGWRLFRW